MVDLDEGLMEWRYRHVKMVQRTIGTRRGTGGSTGAEYLMSTLNKPLFPVTPLLGALMCIFLLMSLMANAETRNFFLIYLAGGFVLYFVYGLWNSKLAKGVVVAGHEPEPDLGARGIQKDHSDG